MNPIEEKIWRFIRGDDSEEKFEEWLYDQFQNPSLTELVGAHLIQQSLEADFRNPHHVHGIRKKLQARLEMVDPRPCLCIIWCDQQCIPIGFNSEIGETEPVTTFIARFTTLKVRTPWLSLIQCPSCSQYWYLAVDTIDDNYHLRRLTIYEAQQIQNGIWPTSFDSFQAVWPDTEWLSLYGFKSLEDWQAKHAT